MVGIKWLYFVSIIFFDQCHSSEKSKANFASNKIVGGHDVGIWKHPYTGGLEFGGIFRCTAVLILVAWLTIPGHCLSKKEVLVVAEKGRIRLGTSFRLQGGTYYNINQVIVHPYYYTRGDSYNLAITQLREFVERDSNKKIIAMWHHDDDFGLVGRKVLIAGFGAEKEDIPGRALKEAYVEVLDSEECNNLFRRLRYNVRIRDSLFCTSAFQASPCPGDGGGPAVYNHSKKGAMLYGISIIGAICKLPTSPSIFIRISFFYSWIINVIRFHYFR